MSAFGTKRTFAFAPHMSAFGGKANMMSAQSVLKKKKKKKKKKRGERTELGPTQREVLVWLT